SFARAKKLARAAECLVYSLTPSGFWAENHPKNRGFVGILRGQKCLKRCFSRRSPVGTIDCRLFCGACWSYITRLLKTPIIGPSAKTVASSWIDILAGLSGLYIFRIPPDFSAHAGSAIDSAISQPPVATNARVLRFISILPD